VARAGTATNVVPASAACDIDVRAFTIAEQERVDREVRALQPVVAGTRLHVSGGLNRPPLEPTAGEALLARAIAVADRLGLGPLEGTAVGGASDGNFTAGVGTPTLDGLGPIGDGAHAEGEHVLIDAMPDRAALLAALVTDLLRG
jgi:glutamate carboxypeptidase